MRPLKNAIDGILALGNTTHLLYPARDTMLGSKKYNPYKQHAFPIVLCPFRTQNNGECKKEGGCIALLPSDASLAGCVLSRIPYLSKSKSKVKQSLLLY